MATKQSSSISSFSTQAEVSDNSLRLFLDSKLAEFEQEKNKLNSLIIEAESEARKLDELTLAHSVTLANIELTVNVLSSKKSAYNKAVDFYQSTL